MKPPTWREYLLAAVLIPWVTLTTTAVLLGEIFDYMVGL